VPYLVNDAFSRLPDCKWQHLTFTLPSLEPILA